MKWETQQQPVVASAAEGREGCRNKKNRPWGESLCFLQTSTFLWFIIGEQLVVNQIRTADLHVSQTLIWELCPRFWTLLHRAYSIGLQYSTVVQQAAGHCASLICRYQIEYHLKQKCDVAYTFNRSQFIQKTLCSFSCLKGPLRCLHMKFRYSTHCSACKTISRLYCLL